LSLSEKLELCLACKKGRLRDIGVDTVKGEARPDTFRHTATMRVRKCDHCGHRQVDEVLEEHTRGPANDEVTGTVIRIDPEEKTEE
jgi:hypothetical protein